MSKPLTIKRNCGCGENLHRATDEDRILYRCVNCGSYYEPRTRKPGTGETASQRKARARLTTMTGYTYETEMLEGRMIVRAIPESLWGRQVAWIIGRRGKVTEL